jgi:hypothetical protein
LIRGIFSGLFVLIGHVYPVWFGFRGVERVLPAVGVILMVDPAVFRSAGRHHITAVSPDKNDVSGFVDGRPLAARVTPVLRF